MNTDELIKKIEKWKEEKDLKAYKAKVEEENKVYNFAEKIRTEFYPRLKDVLRVFIKMKEYGVGFPRFGSIWFEKINSRWYIKLFIGDTYCLVANDTENVDFFTGGAYRAKAVPPKSSELEYFVNTFDSSLNSFYKFVDQTLNS